MELYIFTYETTLAIATGSVPRLIIRLPEEAIIFVGLIFLIPPERFEIISIGVYFNVVIVRTCVSPPPVAVIAFQENNLPFYLS